MEEELQHVKAEAEEQVQHAKDDAAKEKKKLEAELEAKVKDTDELLKSVCEGKTGVYHDCRILISCNIVNIHWLIDANKKEKALRDDLKEAKDTIRILKESTKAANDSEYAMTRKLAYEKRVRRDLEIDLVLAMQSLQNDQVAIAGLEVEIVDLKEATEYVLDMVAPQANPEEPTPLLDRLIAAPDRVTELLKVSCKTAAVGGLLRVKSHYAEVEVTKIVAGPNRDTDLKTLEAEVEAAAKKVVEDLDLVEAE